MLYSHRRIAYSRNVLARMSSILMAICKDVWTIVRRVCAKSSTCSRSILKYQGSPMLRTSLDACRSMVTYLTHNTPLRMSMNKMMMPKTQTLPAQLIASATTRTRSIEDSSDTTPIRGTILWPSTNSHEESIKLCLTFI